MEKIEVAVRLRPLNCHTGNAQWNNQDSSQAMMLSSHLLSQDGILSMDDRSIDGGENIAHNIFRSGSSSAASSNEL
jgi:hypothetical protein